MYIQLGAALKITSNNETFIGTVVAIDEIGFSVAIDGERFSLLWETLQDAAIQIELVNNNTLKKAA